MGKFAKAMRVKTGINCLVPMFIQQFFTKHSTMTPDIREKTERRHISSSPALFHLSLAHQFTCFV